VQYHVFQVGGRAVDRDNLDVVVVGCFSGDHLPDPTEAASHARAHTHRRSDVDGELVRGRVQMFSGRLHRVIATSGSKVAYGVEGKGGSGAHPLMPTLTMMYAGPGRWKKATLS
jgi:hypothetical protein